jgi:hypothetical protein
MKLLDIIEGWYDPPEYPDPDRSGFMDSSLDDIKPHFTFLGYDPWKGGNKGGTDIVVLMDKNTNKGYILHPDNISDDFYESDFYGYQDWDGDTSYENSDPELTTNSYLTWATVCLQDDNVAKSLEEYEDGKGMMVLNRETMGQIKQFEPEWYKVIVDIISSGKKR